MAVDKTSTEADNLYFKGLIDMIPSQFYLDKDTKEELAQMHQKNLGQSVKGKEKRSASKSPVKSNEKRMKYDRAFSRTVSELKAELGEATAQGKSDDNSDDELSQPVNKVKNKKQKTKKHKKKAERRQAVAESVVSLEEARERLREKIHTLEALRNKSRDAEDAIEKKRLRRKAGKLKLKIKRKQEKMNLNKNSSKAEDGTGGTKNIKVRPNKPVYNKDGKVVFSKFDFTDSGVKEKPKGALTGRDYKKLLEKVEKRKEKIALLKEKDTDKAKNLEGKLAWETALQKAEGVKVKDNPILLKKALKRKNKMKEKRLKKWDERQERTDKMRSERQEKRKKNIQAKKQVKIDKKIKKAKKKGRLIPGF